MKEDKSLMRRAWSTCESEEGCHRCFAPPNIPKVLPILDDFENSSDDPEQAEIDGIEEPTEKLPNQRNVPVAKRGSGLVRKVLAVVS